MRKMEKQYIVLIRKKDDKTIVAPICYHACDIQAAINIGEMFKNTVQALTKKDMEFLVIANPNLVERLKGYHEA